MRARYGDWTQGTTPPVGRRVSFLWKDICSFAPVVLSRVRWIIGDGSQVNVTLDPWISSVPISRWPTFVSVEAEGHLRVMDLMEGRGGGWKVSEIARIFGGPLADRVMQVPASTYHGKDLRVWGSSCLPSVSLRDLSDSLRGEPTLRMEAAWIWKLRVHPRSKLFIWKLAWDRLPTCSLLHRRGRLAHDHCPVCGLEEETPEHVIFCCPRARFIWSLITYRPWDRSSAPPRTAFLDCIRQDVLVRNKSSWGPLVVYLAHQIWLSRNRLVFADEVVPSHQILRRAYLLAMEFARFDARPHLHNPGHWDSPAAPAAPRSAVLISWESPPPGFMKINFDGSVKGSRGGAGFVIRDYEGRLLAAGGASLTETSVPQAELHAAWAGVLCAIRILHAARLVIEGDSMIVIQWIRQGALPNPLLQDIEYAIRDAAAVTVRHVYREANSAADWVASFAADHSGPWFWRPGDVYPQGLSLMLYSDFLGLTRTRLV